MNSTVQSHGNETVGVKGAGAFAVGGFGHINRIIYLSHVQ